MPSYYKRIDLALFAFYSYSRNRVEVGGGVNGFPFEIKKANVNPYEALTEHEILDKLEKTREHTAQGMYKDAIKVSHDMMAKYGL